MLLLLFILHYLVSKRGKIILLISTALEILKSQKIVVLFYLLHCNRSIHEKVRYYI